MNFTRKLITLALIAPLPWGQVLRAAEFEVLDRFSVDGYSVFRGSADIPGGSFAVGGSVLAVKSGNVGVGTAGPEYKLQVEGTAALSLPAAGLGGAMGTVDQQDLVRSAFTFENTAQVPLSNIALSSGAKWRAVFRGAWMNNYEGGALSQPGAYVELTSEAPALAVGSITLTLSRNATTGKLQAITSSGSGSKHIGFSGTIEILSSNLNAGWANSMLLQGKVGFGTTGPVSNLEVSRLETVNRQTYTDILTISAPATTVPWVGHGGGILFRGSNYTHVPSLNYARIGSTINDHSSQHYGANLFFDVTPTDAGTLTRAMTIQYDGSVGIGTTSPAATLDVNGAISSQGPAGEASASSFSAATGGSTRVTNYTINAAVTVGSGFSASTGLFQPTVPGRYLFTAGAYSGGSSNWALAISKNGAGGGSGGAVPVGGNGNLANLAMVLNLNGTSDTASVLITNYSGITVSGSNVTVTWTKLP